MGNHLDKKESEIYAGSYSYGDFSKRYKHYKFFRDITYYLWINKLNTHHVKLMILPMDFYDSHLINNYTIRMSSMYVNIYSDHDDNHYKKNRFPWLLDKFTEHKKKIIIVHIKSAMLDFE